MRACRCWWLYVIFIAIGVDWEAIERFGNTQAIIAAPSLPLSRFAPLVVDEPESVGEQLARLAVVVRMRQSRRASFHRKNSIHLHGPEIVRALVSNFRATAL